MPLLGGIKYRFHLYCIIIQHRCQLISVVIRIFHFCRLTAPMAIACTQIVCVIAFRIIPVKQHKKNGQFPMKLAVLVRVSRFELEAS